MEDPCSAPSELPPAPPALPPAPPTLPPTLLELLPVPPPVAASSAIRTPRVGSGLMSRSSLATAINTATTHREAIRGRGEEEEGAGHRHRRHLPSPVPKSVPVLGARTSLPPLHVDPSQLLRSGLMNKGSSSAATAAAAATAHRESIREGERRKQAQAKEGEGVSSSVKHKVSRAKAPSAKRLKSPLASKSTGIRMMLSPRIISPSTTSARSSQESPISPFINKRSMLHVEENPSRPLWRKDIVCCIVT